MRTIEKVIAELKDEMLDGGFTEIHCDKCLDEIIEIRKAEREQSKDAISRQAVLDCAITIETDDFSGNEVLSVVDVEEIKALPSTTPKYSDEEIDRAQAVEQAYVDKMVELSVDSVIDKISTEIQELRGCSCSCSDGIIDDVEEILDEYKAESGEV